MCRFSLHKTVIMQCVDLTMLLGHSSTNLLAQHRECIAPELNHTYRQISFLLGDLHALLLGDDVPKVVKDISEANKLGQTLFRRQQTFFNSPSRTLQTNFQDDFSWRGWKHPRGSLVKYRILLHQRDQGRLQHPKNWSQQQHGHQN